MNVPMRPRETTEPEVETFHCEQRSPEWYQLRLGLPTASNFSTIMARGKNGGESVSRSKLLWQLADERLYGEPVETYRNDHMNRGNEMEPHALEAYSFLNDVDPVRVGFVRRRMSDQIGPNWFVGCSPDGLIGDDGIVQIKTMLPDLLLALRHQGAAGFPSEHRAQCQGELWITGRKWCDLFIFWPKRKPAKFRIVRDEVYIRQLRDEVERFNYELARIIADDKRMG